MSNRSIFNDPILPIMSGGVENGAKFATRCSKKHKVNRLRLSKNAKLRRIRKSKLR